MIAPLHLGLAALVASCCVAHRCGGGGSAWAWGLLGPLGWLLAALAGMRGVLGGMRQMAESPHEKTRST